MRQLLLLLTLLCGLLPAGSRADDAPCITFLVPYYTTCNAMTNKNEVHGFFDSSKKNPIFEAEDLLSFNNIFDAKTYLLESKRLCKDVDEEYSTSGNKLFGFPAEKLGPVSGTFNEGTNTEVEGSIQIYFINLGCGSQALPQSISNDIFTGDGIQTQPLSSVADGAIFSDDLVILAFIVQDQTFSIPTANGQDQNCCITLIIPYRTTCVRQTDGTDKIQFQILTDKQSKKMILVNSNDVDFFTDAPPLNFDGVVPFLQAKQKCFEISSQVQSGFLFGYPAQKFGPVSGQYTLASNEKRCGDIQVYLLNCGCGIDQDVSAITDNVYETSGTEWLPPFFTSIPLIVGIKSEGVTLFDTIKGLQTANSDGAECRDCVSLLVPYRVICTKVNGKDVIKVQMLVDSTSGGHNLILKRTAGDLQVNQFTNDDFTASGKTQLLQAIDSCKDLNTEYDATQTISGNPAVKYGPTSGKYSSQACVEDGDLQVFFLDVGFNFAFVESSFATNETTTLSVKWVDLDNNGTVLNIIGDQFITNTIPTSGDVNKVTVSKLLTTLAKGLNHDTSCATNPFNLNDEYSKALMCRLMDALQGCPQPFNAEGSVSSCGSSSKVKVSGKMTKSMRIDVCGKKYCLTSVPSVVVPNAIFTGQAGQDIVTCLADFFIQYLAYIRTQFEGVFACGFGDELQRVLLGRELKFGGGLVTFTLHLRKVQGLEDTYDFILIGKQGNDAQIYETGCRFKIAPCSPCCK